MSRKATALKEPYQSTPGDHALQRCQRSPALRSLCTAYGQLIESIQLNGIGNGQVGSASIDAFTSQCLPDAGWCFTAAQSSGGLRSRDLRIGQHAARFQAIEGLGNQCGIRLKSSEPGFEFAPGAARARQGIERPIDQSNHCGRVEESLQCFGV